MSYRPIEIRKAAETEEVCGSDLIPEPVRLYI